MAQVRALVREGVLEKLFTGEELEIRVVDPALAHPFIGQPVSVLEQQQPDHEAGLDPRPPVLAVERCDLAVDPVPIDLAGKQNQLVLGRIVPSDAQQNHGPKGKGIQKRNCRVRGSQAPNPCNLKCRRIRKTDSRSIA
jgi:hypothetical protein